MVEPRKEENKKEFDEATAALPSTSELRFEKDDFKGSKLHGDELSPKSPSMLQSNTRGFKEQKSGGSKLHGDELLKE